MPTEVFVHPDGDDAGAGTMAHPFRTIAAGVAAVADGGIVSLRSGTFYGEVEIVDVQPANAPVVIRSFPGERAVLESSLAQFRGTTPNHAWRQLGTRGEFVSVKPIKENDPTENRVRGAFSDRVPYTRLVSYARVEDLRATGETFPKVLPTDPGFEEFDGNVTTKGFKRPWVYMGPGVWLDEDAHVHIRLSHTHNNIFLWDDYEGVSDPRRIRLAISPRLSTALTLRRCHDVEIRNLSIRYGGERTVAILACSNILFDHVSIRAASQAIRLDKDRDSLVGCDSITLRDCRIDGGTPTWFFRSDRKDGYSFKVGDAIVDNDLGASTSSVCFSGNDAVPLANVTVSQCEFVNVHDLPVFGANPRYHHNWLDNINDDALLFIQGTTDARVHHNVLTRVLTALSFADSGASEQVSVYRNLIDLRTPTLGVRPGLDGPGQSLRQGQLYKSNGTEGPIDIFQNTCISVNAGMTNEDSQGNAVAFSHYRNLTGGRRRTINNIFVAVYSAPGQARPIAVLPPKTFPGPTDGNLYHRLGSGSQKFLVPNPSGAGGLVPRSGLGGYQIEQSPYERRGQSADPLFRSMGADGLARPSDDFRLRANSPARRSGAFLFGMMRVLDGIPINQVDTEFSRPDVGCYPRNDAPLAVGVDRRRIFPAPTQ